MKPLARREYVEVYRYRGRRYGIQGSQGYTVDTWTVGGWRECRGGTLSSGDQHVYSRPGNDKCSENAGSLRELYVRSKCGSSLLPSVFAQNHRVHRKWFTKFRGAMFECWTRSTSPGKTEITTTTSACYYHIYNPLTSQNKLGREGTKRTSKHATSLLKGGNSRHGPVGYAL